MSAPPLAAPPARPKAGRRGRGRKPAQVPKVAPTEGGAPAPTRVGHALTQAKVFLAPYRRAAEPAIRALRQVLDCVSGLGWAVVGAAVAAWIVAWSAGWREFALIASILGALFILGCLFTIGRTRLDVDLEVSPIRVKVGESAAARFQVRNAAKVPLLPVHLTFPVGESAARFTLPALRPSATYEDVVVIPTRRRSVVVVGPITTQRGDPFGLVRRELVWARPVELFVHPETVPLEPLGSGLLRDLEGHTTNDISMSDLAFHTLREYTPGDDRRYIHWRSSAKQTSARGVESFMVKQFLDTRRSHIAVVVDMNPASYGGEQEFELAVSVGASVAVRTLADEMDLTIVCGSQTAAQPPPHIALDTFSRAVPEEIDLAPATGRLIQLSPDASVVLLITGQQSPIQALLAARTFLPVETNAIAVRVHRGAAKGLAEASGLTVVTIGSLADLPVVLTGGIVQ